jgi:hypothetical protein
LTIAKAPGLTVRGLPSDRLIPFKVMSSWVGPNPPRVMRTLGRRSSDSRVPALIWSRESRSFVTLSSLHPSLWSCFAIQWEFVSSV